MNKEISTCWQPEHGKTIPDMVAVSLQIVNHRASTHVADLSVWHCC